MSFPKLWLAAPLLLAACGKPPQERARLSALHRLQHELRPPARLLTESLVVYDFSKATVSYFSSDVPTFDDGHLVTFETAVAGSAPHRQAMFVAGNDSAFYFLPARHAAEFERRYHVATPATAP